MKTKPQKAGGKHGKRARAKHVCAPVPVRGAQNTPLDQMPGHMAGLVLRCRCGKISFKHVKVDPNYVPAERGSARDVLDWIDAKLGHVPDGSDERSEPPPEPAEHDHRWVLDEQYGDQERLTCAERHCTAIMTRPLRVAA